MKLVTFCAFLFNRRDYSLVCPEAKVNAATTGRKVSCLALHCDYNALPYNDYFLAINVLLA